VGWLPYLVTAGKQLLAQESFDLIYASAPSFAAFLGAARLSKRSRVPWVAEYRDPWSRDVYRDLPRWRGPLDAWMEDRTVKSASGVVTVSEPFSNLYRERFGKPTIAIYNGFDRDSVSQATDVPTSNPLVSIVYLGILYGGLRDPSRLYHAIRNSSLSPRDIRVTYYGPTATEVLPLAKELGVEEFIEIRPRVDYQQSLKIQREADILLLLQSPDDPGNVPAKFFEYLAARRPILGLGLEEGIPAQIINERGAGLYVSDTDILESKLKEWVRAKKTSGSIPAITGDVLSGLSREEQFDKLIDFLTSTLVHRGRGER
jgi:glycosyltransferase involved in cell wall biosynthesis